MSKGSAFQKVKSFIQNIHHFRDEALKGSDPPDERVVVFDEAQRAWDREHTSKFMAKKHGFIDFNQSEPEFLLSYMDRHHDWCVVVALIGNGQEIDSGEAGVSGWLKAVRMCFPHWDVYSSGEPIDTNDETGFLSEIAESEKGFIDPALHLATSIRSFRSEILSSLVEVLLAGNSKQASTMYAGLENRYPIRLTRDLTLAKKWIRQRARGTESIGFVSHSKAHRLRAEGVYVMRRPRYSEIINWYLAPPEDVRSSHILEEVASEYEVQGLELDWLIVGWDANFRFAKSGIEHWNFVGSQWKRILNPSEQRALANSYRVLLTRARQGMVIYVPQGSTTDMTRNDAWYDANFSFLEECGFEVLGEADIQKMGDSESLPGGKKSTLASSFQPDLFSTSKEVM